MGKLTYGLDATSLKPFVAIGSKTYPSTNVLGTADCWQTTARGTGGQWYTPTQLTYFNLTLTYADGVLRVYRNGMIDQVVEIKGLKLSHIHLGGFSGWMEDCIVYNRALNQREVKKLTERSISYVLSDSQLARVNVYKKKR
jgi:hypothetical protein